MSTAHSDALVFFGATGDLAYKKIFPSLQAMLKRGHLTVPVIGVARSGWKLDQLRARARDSLEHHGGLDPAAMDAYERILGDAMAGDATLFAREDYVEEAWRIVDPVLKAKTPVHEYEPNTWGPAEVDKNIVPPGGWQNPMVTG
jgi:glucose-6-phosphate 1-dehydrogenase